jgi:hypothetical protein
MIVVASDIRRVARRVRYWAEQEASKAGIPPNLECFCAIGARKLFQELKKEKFPKLKLAVFDDGDEAHCFVLCGNYLVDVTASQFGGSKVVVRHKNRSPDYLPYFWKHDHNTFKTVKAFNTYVEGWPSEQVTLEGLIASKRAVVA